ncbi:MAG: carbohydrate ABC transporter permease [Candidatus Caldarchaeum sp.]|nr:carbohydrate ABC transporter permease [Candidatus Caldarchaeum sp.]
MTRFWKIVRTILAVLAATVAIFPIYWMASTSLKLPGEWSAYPPIWIPNTPRIENFLVILSDPGTPLRESALVVLGRGFSASPSAVPNIINSLIVAVSATVGAVLAGTLAAYSISRYRTGGLFTYIFILATRMFPPVAIAIPLMVVYGLAGWVDTHWGLSLIYMAISVAYVTWILKTFFDEIPRDIEDSAVLFGLSRAKAFFKVVLPITKNGLLAASLFTFIINWGEYAFALMFTVGGKATTMPVTISQLQLGAGYQYGPMAALGLLALLPALVFGYVVQKYMVVGYTLGAVKGRR